MVMSSNSLIRVACVYFATTTREPHDSLKRNEHHDPENTPTSSIQEHIEITIYLLVGDKSIPPRRTKAILCWKPNFTTIPFLRHPTHTHNSRRIECWTSASRKIVVTPGDAVTKIQTRPAIGLGCRLASHWDAERSCSSSGSFVAYENLDKSHNKVRYSLYDLIDDGLFSALVGTGSIYGTMIVVYNPGPTQSTDTE